MTSSMDGQDLDTLCGHGHGHGHKHSARKMPGAPAKNSALEDCPGGRCMSSLDFHRAQCKKSPELYDATQVRVSTILLEDGHYLEALNFCLCALDRSSAGCQSHANFDPTLAFKELKRYAQSDFDPTYPPPMNIRPHPQCQLLFNLAFASFNLYGACVFSTSILRLAHHANQHHYPLLLAGVAHSTKAYDVKGLCFRVQPLGLHDNFTGIRVDEAAAYHMHHVGLWGGEKMKGWLADCEEEVKRKACDAIDCGKVEEKAGMWLMCARCKEWWYCSPGCQRRDWEAGSHKKICKDK
ncbi:hypothetical protein P167DRAFT_550346 [Morchella conica CCBAS932]|uniref:MYND-type domain-containing protein n=1 Tax=Morchella conica CCBAS932 TaxID=1392247 RepID=A0A3N4KBE9_9PEZI|nr:hypothetical protein P167DRAFT_550346 [Morchella conica CCBAS932]